MKILKPFVYTLLAGLVSLSSCKDDEPNPCDGSDLSLSVEGSTNSLTANATGGTGPYEYSINGGNFQSTGIFENLEQTDYLVTVKDGAGCSVTTQLNAGNLWEVLQSTGDGARNNAVDIDQTGSLFFAGTHSGTNNFGGTEIIGDSDTYLGKYDATGNLAWILSISGNGNIAAPLIKVDNDGNVYLAGIFSSTLNVVGETLTSAGNYNTYAAKFDTNGNLLWLKHFSGGDSRISSLAIDNENNLIMTGGFTGDFNIGNESFTTETNKWHNYLTKFNSQGELQWINNNSGTERLSGSAVATDNNGNIFLTGYFTQSVSFGNTDLTSLGSTDIFLVKYNSNGEAQWAKQAGSSYSSGNYSDQVGGIAVDNSGNAYITGRYYETAYFDNFSLTATSHISSMYVAKYSSTGSVSWVKSIGDGASGTANSITINSTGNIQVVGDFHGNMTIGNTNIASINTNTTLYLATYSPTGSVVSAIQAGGSDFSGVLPKEMVSNDRYTFVTGSFYGAPEIGNANLETSEEIKHAAFVWRVAN